MQANEIKNKTFKKKINGYAKQEVHDFQHEVMKIIDNLEISNQHLQQELYNKNQKLEAFLGKEDTLNRSIVVAQEAADRLRENALTEAELIVSQAEQEAERILTEAAQKATAVNTETDNLQETARTFLHQTLGLLNYTRDTLEHPRWDILFSEKPIGTVETPSLDEVLAKYQLPLRNNEGETIFAKEQQAAEETQALDAQQQSIEAFLNNDRPAIFPEEMQAQLAMKGEQDRDAVVAAREDQEADLPVGESEPDFMAVAAIESDDDSQDDSQLEIAEPALPENDDQINAVNPESDEPA